MANDVYVLGGGQTDFARNWTKEGKGAVAMLREVIGDGLPAAGLTLGELSEMGRAGRAALYVGNFIAERYVSQGHLGALPTEAEPLLSGLPSARYEAACASGSVAIDAARAHIAAGDYDVAVVVGWELMKTVDSKTCGDYLGYAALREAEAEGVDFPFPKLFGRLADVLLERCPAGEATFMNALAEISRINYENASRNPLAQARTWFMDGDAARARGRDGNGLVGGRLAVSDCSQVTDGAALVVLASDGFVRDHGLSAPRILGWGHRVAPMRFDAKVAESRGEGHPLPWTCRAVEDAYGRAGVHCDDVDVFETHDCFTSSEYAALSAFGIAETGREYEAVLGGDVSFKGRKPVNPSGGLIGCGHPVGASGVRMLLDLWRQVAGRAGGYQVPGATTAAMLNIGGSATTNFCFVVGE